MKKYIHTCNIYNKNINIKKDKRIMSKQLAVTRSKPKNKIQEEANKQAQSQQYRHQSDITDIALFPSLLALYKFHPVHIPPAISPCQLRAGICQHGRHFLALIIKANLCILTVKPILHSQTKFTDPKFDKKSLQSLQSHPSDSCLLILFLKSSRLFNFFISIGTIYQNFEAKNLIYTIYRISKKIRLSSEVVFCLGGKMLLKISFKRFQGSRIGIGCVCMHAYFHLHTHISGHAYVDTYTHFFTMTFKVFKNFSGSYNFVLFKILLLYI